MPAGALSDRFGVRKLTLWAGVLMTGGVFAQALATSFPLLLGARLVFGTGYAVIWTAGAERSRAGIGVVMGLLNGVWAVTVLLSPLMAGFVAGFASAQAVFGLSATACMVVLAATAVAVRSPRRRAAAPGTAVHLEHAGRSGYGNRPRSWGDRADESSGTASGG